MGRDGMDRAAGGQNQKALSAGAVRKCRPSLLPFPKKILWKTAPQVLQGNWPLSTPIYAQGRKHKVKTESKL